MRSSLLLLLKLSHLSGAEAKLAAVGEACRRVDVDCRGVDLPLKTRRVFHVTGDYRLAVACVVLIDVGDEHGFIEAINGEIIERRGEQRESEGCLSLPGKFGKTLRPMYVKFKAQDRYGNWFEAEGDGLFARCVCHEFDHLDGHVFTERLAPGERVIRD